MKTRAACINRIRGLLAEFGLVFAQGSREPQGVLSDALEAAHKTRASCGRC